MWADGSLTLRVDKHNQPSIQVRLETITNYINNGTGNYYMPINNTPYFIRVILTTLHF